MDYYTPPAHNKRDGMTLHLQIRNIPLRLVCGYIYLPAFRALRAVAWSSRGLPLLQLGSPDFFTLAVAVLRHLSVRAPALRKPFELAACRALPSLSAMLASFKYKFLLRRHDVTATLANRQSTFSDHAANDRNSFLVSTTSVAE